MADVNANIGVGIDTSDALNQLKSLQRQIAQFHSSIAKSSESAGIAQRDLQKNFLNSVNSIQGFSAELRTVRTTAESFTNSLEKNKFSMREYFRFAAGATGKFGKNFAAEFSTIEKTATERVKTLQTQYIKMGRDASGAMQAIAVRPTILDMKDLGTQTAIAAQKQVIFNQLVKQGSTNLLNFGKNTQWAGRQLMVGFTLPLATLGMTAGRVFFDMEKAAIKFKKVYGDLFTAPEETKQALESIVTLGQEYTAYGLAVSEAVDLASEAAAAGFAGADLQNQTAAALKLSVLGQLELNQALETTISLQNAFAISSAQLAEEIDFLNAVENQTVVSLDDMTTAIPKVAPVIQSLGGDVRDLAFFMAAMKEGGINASEGANALKSGLASLINPTGRANEFLTGFGINLRGIVDANQGNVAGIVTDFARALDKLDPTNRARVIEQLFGKFQFARLSTLFENVIKEGTQAERVLQLTGATAEELATLSETELGTAAASSMNKFKKAVEGIKLALVPIGELMVEIATPIVEFGSKMLDAFNQLPDGIKKSIGTAITIIGGIGPIALMTFGLINNGIANMIKFFATVRLGYLKITGQAQGIGDETQYMTTEQLEASAAAASLDQAHAGLTQRFTVEKVAVDALRASYEQAVAAGNRFAMLNPGMMKPGSPKKFAAGGAVGGSGNRDTVPAMLTPGEFVVKKDVAQRNKALLEALNGGKLPGFNQGGMVGKGFSNATMFLPESLNTLMGGAGPGAATGDVTAYLKKAADAAAAPLMAVMAREMGIKLNDPALLEEWKVVGSSLIQSATDALEKSGREFITDDDFEELVVPAMKENVKTLNVAGKELSTAMNNAFDEIRTVAPLGSKSGAMGGTGRVSLPGSYRGVRVPAQTFALGSNPEMFQQTERFSQSRSRIVKSFQTQNVATGQSEVATMAHLKRSITTTVDNLILKVAPYLGDQSARIVKAVSKGTVEGIEKSTRQASPSKEAYDAGVNIGRGAIEGIASQTDEAAAAGTSLGQAATAGRGSRRASSGGNVMFDTQSSQYVSQAKAAKLLEGRQLGLARASQMTLNSIQNFSTKLSGASFALSSIAGITSMFGGVVGEAAGAIMQITSLFFALSTITMGLVKAKTAQKTVEMISSLASGKTAAGAVSAVGGFAGGARGVAGARNILGNVGNIFKTFIPILGKIPPLFLKLIPIVGLLVTGFSIGLAVFNKTRESINRLGETANLSADKLKKVGEIFGVDLKAADFGAAFTGPAAKRTSEQRTQTQQVLETETFEADFKTQIDAIKNAGKQDAERTLNALALQLSSAGLDSKAVQALIDAIVIKAERTDLDLKFAGVSFSSAEGLASITKIADDTSKILSTKFAAMSGDLGQKLLNIFGGGDFKTQIQTSAGELSSILQSLKTGFESGDISAEQFNEKIAEIDSTIRSLDPAIARELVFAISDNLEIGDKVKDLRDYEDQLMLIKAAAAGIDISEEDVDLLVAAGEAGADTKTLNAANKLRDKYIKQIKTAAAVTEDLTAAEEAQAVATASVQTAKDDVAAQITALEEEKVAYDILVTAGWKAADAVDAVGNAAIRQALAMGNDTERKELIADLEYLAKLRKDSPVTRGTGGGGAAQRDPYKEAIESLTSQRKEIENNIKAFNGLRKAGFSVAEAAEAAGDATIAAGLASKKVGSKEWKALVRQIRAARLEALKTPDGIKNAFEGLKQQAEDYYSILERTANRKFQDSIKSQEKAIDDLGDAIQSVNEEIDTYQDRIDSIQRSITMEFDRPIEALQEESSDLANDLTLMDRAAGEITKRYDEQSKALSRVAQANQQIINQQKSQMSLADALASGDIGAAASIMQDMRAAEADAAAATQEQMLTAARDSQIAGLRSAGGMSREQIEQRQFTISQSIFKLEEAREIKALSIRNIEDQIFAIQTNKLDPLTKQQTAAEKALKTIQDQRQAELDAIDAQRQKWEDAELALGRAEIKAGKFNGVINMAKKITGDVVSNWESIKNKVVTLTINTIRNETSIKKASGGVVKMSGGGKVSSYLANGGAFGPSLGSDTVPAMLTPGEFVVNRKAASKFGPMLSAINSNTFSGGMTANRYKSNPKMYLPKDFNAPVYSMPQRDFPKNQGVSSIYNSETSQGTLAQVDNSVYNYNLSVNVEGSNASADQIANVVVNKLRGIQSQKVRGQVIR